MKQYFDIYIRQAGAILEALPWAEDGTLTGWHKLELPDKGAKFSLEGQKREIGDGTELSDGEVANFSGATLWVTSDEWDELREDFHNQKCDLVLYDHNAGMIVAVCYGMQMNISTILTSGESELITVSGTKTMSTAGADMYIFLEREETEGEILMGIEITGELEAFSANEGEASASQFYNVKGIRLAERIDITAPTGMELSTDEATWDNPISVAKDYDDKIHARISAEAESGEIDGNIAHASEGVTSRNLAVEGTVIAELPEQVATPTFSPESGTLTLDVDTVAIASATSGATIHYTTDGSTPTTGSATYSTPLVLTSNSTITVKALAVKSGYTDSEVASTTFVVYDAATKAWHAGLPYPADITPTTIVAMDTLIRTLKSQGNFTDILDILYVFAINTLGGSGQGKANSLVNVVNPGTYDASILGGLDTWAAHDEEGSDYDGRNGWIGETAKGLTTGYTPDGNGKFKGTNASMAVFCFSNNTTQSKYACGVIDTLSGNNAHGINLTNSSSGYINAYLGALVASSTAGGTTSKGLCAIDRESNIKLVAYAGDGTADATPTTTDTDRLPAYPIYVTCRNMNQAISQEMTAVRIGAFLMGGSLGATKYGQIRAALIKFMDDVGSQNPIEEGSIFGATETLEFGYNADNLMGV